ncbi:MAG: hypothetical protein JXN59_07165, partial [Anaerolineae bacterium]|nr:hypothetical protein [Anaerolineae bacterium]
ARVLRPGGRMVITTNLRGHMAAFYDTYARTLREMARGDLLARLEAHVNHRLTAADVQALMAAAGLAVVRTDEQTAVMRFLDGTALLSHAFVRSAFAEAWVEFLPPEDVAPVLARLEANLNALAARAGELALTIPMAYFEAEKPA